MIYRIEGHPSQQREVADTPRMAMQNLCDNCKGQASMSVLVSNGDKLIATLETDIFGNPTIQFLESEVYNKDSSVVSQLWSQYGINGLGELLRLNADRYVNQGK